MDWSIGTLVEVTGCFWRKIGYDVTLFILSKDKVYKDIEAEILLKIKDILRTKPSLRFAKKIFSFKI